MKKNMIMLCVLLGVVSLHASDKQDRISIPEGTQSPFDMTRNTMSLESVKKELSTLQSKVVILEKKGNTSESWKEFIWQNVTGTTVGAVVLQKMFPAALGVVASKTSGFLPAIVVKSGVVASVAASPYILLGAAVCLFAGKVMFDRKLNKKTGIKSYDKSDLLKTANNTTLFDIVYANTKAIKKPTFYTLGAFAMLVTFSNAHK